MLPVLDAIFLIALGGIIWISNLGIIHINWGQDWPGIIVLIGVIQLIKQFVKRRRQSF
jgi:hypothetical protein